MSEAKRPPERLLVPISDADVAMEIRLALNMTKGRKLEEAIAREANSAVADRLIEYFRQSGIVLMRPPPRIPHSSNPDTDRAAIARAEEEDRRRRDA